MIRYSCRTNAPIPPLSALWALGVLLGAPCSAGAGDGGPARCGACAGPSFASLVVVRVAWRARVRRAGGGRRRGGLAAGGAASVRAPSLRRDASPPDSHPRAQRRAADSLTACGGGGPVAAQRRAAAVRRSAVRAVQHADTRQRASAARCLRLARRGGRASHRVVRRDAGVGRRRRGPRALHGDGGRARPAGPRGGEHSALRSAGRGAAGG
jgi:hypothetical protein